MYNSDYLIIIDNEIKTSQVYDFRELDNSYSVRFKEGGQEYFYSKSRFKLYRRIKEYQTKYLKIYCKGVELRNVSKLVMFGTYSFACWYVVCEYGEKVFREEDIKLVESCLCNSKVEDVFNYFKEIAKANSLKNDEGKVLLYEAYRKVTYINNESTLANFLYPKEYKIKAYAKRDLIFPFEFNKSQMNAIEMAFTNQVSVIQGPPGTGKTQTILNIICNIVLRGKSVLVVSSNNSALENVKERLEVSDMGFLISKLGNVENKNAFYDKQDAINYRPQKFSLWENNDKEINFRNLQKQNKELVDAFKKQERLAVARHELSQLRIEQSHYDRERGVRNEYKIRHNISSKKILNLLLRIEDLECKIANSKCFFSRLYRRILWIIVWWYFGVSYEKMRKNNLLELIQRKFYEIKRKELEDEINVLEIEIREISLESKIKDVCHKSNVLLKDNLYKRYNKDHCRKIYGHGHSIIDNTKEFLSEYPIVLSTAFSSRQCIDNEIGFDYVIMDEASQVSVETGALALSCAKNAIIVGDSLQLPNVINNNERVVMKAILDKYDVSTFYDCSKYSFLDSLINVLKDVPSTLLREHYRCHPKIIDFCNKKFYGGNLIIMTEDKGEKDTLQVIRTGNLRYCTRHSNNREADVVCKEILPFVGECAEQIGVITPFRDQVKLLSARIDNSIEVSTVHSFQGREKNVIILSTVLDKIKPFIDDCSLINVAVSRAKNKLCLVTTGNDLQADSNLNDLIKYIEYNNGLIIQSKVWSIYDILYSNYTCERSKFLNKSIGKTQKIDINVIYGNDVKAKNDYLKKLKKVSEYDSENITYDLIVRVLASKSVRKCLSVVMHYPMKNLIRNYSFCSDEEIQFAKNDNTHLDFIIFNTVTKLPVLAIEVDGFSYHGMIIKSINEKGDVVIKPSINDVDRQIERDVMKNHILDLCKIPLIRFNTIGSGEEQILEEKLEAIFDRGELQKRRIKNN